MSLGEARFLHQQAGRQLTEDQLPAHWNTLLPLDAHNARAAAQAALTPPSAAPARTSDIQTHFTIEGALASVKELDDVSEIVKRVWPYVSACVPPA